MSVQAAIALGVAGELLAIAVVLGCVTLLVRLLGCLEAVQDDGGSDSGGGGSHDGLRDGPSGGGEEVEPAWWPQFERDFVRFTSGERELVETITTRALERSA